MLLEVKNESPLIMETTEKEEEEEPVEINSLQYVNRIDRVITHKWHTKVTIIVQKEYLFSTIALIDSGVDLCCINEGLVPSKYFSKIVEELHTADSSKMSVKYK